MLTSMPQLIGTETAKLATKRLFGFFPEGAASDPEVFATGVVQLLAGYPLFAIEAILSPRSGLPAKHEFLPSIVKIKEALETCVQEHWIRERRASIFERADIPQIVGPSSPPPKPTLGSKHSELCERYGIRDVPPGWDAIDVVRAAHRFSDQFPAKVEELLGGGPDPLAGQRRSDFEQKQR